MPSLRVEKEGTAQSTAIVSSLYPELYSLIPFFVKIFHPYSFHVNSNNCIKRGCKQKQYKLADSKFPFIALG